MSEYVWEVGVENLRVAYEEAQREIQKEEDELLASIIAARNRPLTVDRALVNALNDYPKI